MQWLAQTIRDYVFLVSIFIMWNHNVFTKIVPVIILSPRYFSNMHDVNPDLDHYYSTKYFMHNI